MPENYLHGKPPPHAHPLEDAGSAHKYFGMIPHTITRGQRGRGLSLPARWLYVYLKGVAGDGGTCTRSTGTMVEEAQLSRGAITRAKAELQTAGLITLIARSRKDHETDIIRLVDIWPENMAEFATHKSCTPDVQGCTCGVPGCTPDVQGCTCGVPKKNSLRKTQKEEQTLPPIVPPRGEPYSAGFLTFWQAYPAKKGKDQAWRVWQRRKLESKANEICASIPTHQAHDRAWKDGYIKNPATYLNQGCWQDEFAAQPPAYQYDLTAWATEEPHHDQI